MSDVSNFKLNGVTYLVKDRDSRDKIGVSTGERYILKERIAGSKIEGYSYCAFAGGTNFAGYELYAFRAAPRHRTYSSVGYGKILFYSRTKENEFEKLNVTLNYNSSTYGELRDPNLSVSRDGTRLYVSCFTTIDQSSSTYNSIIFVLDKTLTQIGAIITPNSVFWGNTLETPDGYLLHADYNDSSINIYRSSDIVTSSNLSTLTMSKVITIATTHDDYVFEEPNISYYKDKLICLIRDSGTGPGYITYTYNLNGDGGWVPFTPINYRLHAPCLQCYSSDRFIVFSGSVLGDVTGNTHRRMPFVGLIDYTDPYDVHVYGELVESKDNWAEYGYGGYTTLVKVDESRYGILYYEEDNQTSTETAPVNGLYFRLCNINRLLGSTYTSLNNYDQGIKWYSPPQATAYSYSLLNWVQDALNESAKKFDFVINVSSNISLITDIPDVVKTTALVTGTASRRGTSYYVTLKWYSGNDNPMAEIQWNTAYPNRPRYWYVSRLYDEIEVTITGNAWASQYIALPYKAGYVISHICVVSASSSVGFLLAPPMNVTNDAYTRACLITSGTNTVKLRVYYEPKISS